VIVVVPQGRDLLKELLLFGWEHGVEVDFELVESTPTEHRRGTVVTVLGTVVSPADLALVASAIATSGGNIDRIVRLSKYPVMSYELLVEGADEHRLRELLVTVHREGSVDVAVQREGLGRRAVRLIVLDVDSTLIQDEVIDLLADEAGCHDEVAVITEAAMRGDLDFESALRQRVRLLAGLDQAALDRVWERLRFTPGARTFVRTLKRLGYRVAIVSGGFTRLADRIADELCLDHTHANTFEIVDGKLTGELVGPIVDRQRKAALLREIAASEDIPLSQTVAVGDGANDVEMLSAAGLGIAFNAKPAVSRAADTSLTVPYLDAILFMLGVRREEVEAADAEDPTTAQLRRPPIPRPAR
jgi:phosphoserine phosphatase